MSILSYLSFADNVKHFVAGFHGYGVSADIEALIRDYYVGYVCDVAVDDYPFQHRQEHHHHEAQRPEYAHHLTLVTKRGTYILLGARQIHALLHDLQQIAKNAGHERPLMIGTDQEHGLVSAFTITDNDVAGTQLSVARYRANFCTEADIPFDFVVPGRWHLAPRARPTSQSVYRRRRPKN